MKKQKKKKRFRYLPTIVIALIIIGLCLPQRLIIPVEGATSKDWHPETFWYYPWGKSVTHKGVDIFAEKGRPVLASTYGIVLFKGEFGAGGESVFLPGPKWRLHYFAHLNDIHTTWFDLVKKGKRLGTVGATGNACGKPPHLHYSVITIIPYPWKLDKSRQGWKKMFFLNPLKMFK